MVSQQLQTGCKPKTVNGRHARDIEQELANSLFAVATSRDKRAFAFNIFRPK